MKKLLSIIAAFSMVSVANAQDSNLGTRLENGSSTLRLLLGGNQASSVVGLDYERRADRMGVGAFLLKTSKRTVAASDKGFVAVDDRPESYVLGLTAPLHLVDKSNFDIYIAPGITVGSYTDVAHSATENKNVVTFGPALKIGTMYYINEMWSVGADFMTVTNWTSDRVSGQLEYANLAVGYTF